MVKVTSKRLRVTSKRLRLIPVSERLTLIEYMCKVKGNTTCERLASQLKVFGGNMQIKITVLSVKAGF